ncbi:hypothetical protein ABPG75_010607 [Micractinium tetrahymenae]
MASWLDGADGLAALHVLEARLAQCQEALALGGGAAPSAAAAAAAAAFDLRSESDLSPETKFALVVIAVLLVIFAGLMAGLTLGLLSLDKVDLEIIKRSGTPREVWLVERVEPVLARPHYLLATLLLCNAAAMEALPLLLDRLLNPVAAILLSVSAILVFGEIVPQAVCKRYGLQVGAYMAWFMRFLMLATAGITWPIGKLLDWILGEESALFKRRELKALVSMHAEPAEDGEQSTLTADEAQIIQGALDMASKTAESAMTPMTKVMMLSSEAEVNGELLLRILGRGHSRLPVYEGANKENIMGLVLVKELLLVDEDEGAKIRDLRLRELPFLSVDTMLYDVLRVFRYGRSHMACLTRPSPETGRLEVIGIITIEDVLEELLQQEIVDETDQYVDNLQTVKSSTLTSLSQLPPQLRRLLTRSNTVAAPERAAGRSTHGAAAAASAGAAAAAATVAGVSLGTLGTAPHSPRAVAAAAATTALLAARRAAGGGVSSASLPSSAGPALPEPPQPPQRAGEAGTSAPARTGGPLSGLLAQDKPPVPRRTSSSRSLWGKLSQADMRRQGSAALRQPLLKTEHEGESSSGAGSWSQQRQQDEGNPQQALHARQQQQIAEMLRRAQEAEAGAAGDGQGLN